jgi:hypothetical protein
MEVLIARMRGLLRPLQERADARRFFLGTYLRTTEAVAERIDRGEFDDPPWVEVWDIAFADLYLRALEARRRVDHERIDEILAGRVAAEDMELAKVERPGERTLLDRMLVPFNQAATRRFLAESRRKVWRNAMLLSHARRDGTLPARLDELEALCTRRVSDLRAPGQVLLRLARKGFGVELAEDGR